MTLRRFRREIMPFVAWAAVFVAAQWAVGLFLQPDGFWQQLATICLVRVPVAGVSLIVGFLVGAWVEGL